mmetsp:Transcript_36342/g.85449  ORF Transcript_36342/g.85449 Transcript_36342/m.85449 type:complete len:115 (-) Transcript_36342:178-522(-)
MANAKVFEELKAALNGASASQLNSHSTLKAAEALLTCLRRDGVAGGGGAYAPVGASGAPSLHYGMSYVDGNKASAGHVNAHGVNTHGYSAKAVATEKGRSTEGVMKGSSWSSNY